MSTTEWPQSSLPSGRAVFSVYAPYKVRAKTQTVKTKHQPCNSPTYLPITHPQNTTAADTHLSPSQSVFRVHSSTTNPPNHSCTCVWLCWTMHAEMRKPSGSRPHALVKYSTTAPTQTLSVKQLANAHRRTSSAIDICGSGGCDGLTVAAAMPVGKAR